RRAVLAADRLESARAGAPRENALNLGEPAVLAATIMNNGVFHFIRLHVQMAAAAVRHTHRFRHPHFLRHVSSLCHARFLCHTFFFLLVVEIGSAGSVPDVIQTIWFCLRRGESDRTAPRSYRSWRRRIGDSRHIRRETPPWTTRHKEVGDVRS